jgi:uncharacterized membrane protein YhaH (DUF805 family)
MNWYLQVLKKYAVFEGRARRKEYWFFQLFNVIAVIVLAIIDSALENTGPATDFLGILSGLYILATFLPGLGVLIRRLHDTDRSGWWVLISFVPLVGGIVLLVFTVTEGTPGPNKYGADPKQPAAAFAPYAATPPNYAAPNMQPMAQAAGAGVSQQAFSQAAPAFCSSCGKPLVAGSNFCASCGRAI